VSPLPVSVHLERGAYYRVQGRENPSRCVSEHFECESFVKRQGLYLLRLKTRREPRSGEEITFEALCFQVLQAGIVKYSKNIILAK
jgi:hypothetical protein